MSTYAVVETPTERSAAAANFHDLVMMDLYIS